MSNISEPTEAATSINGGITFPNLIKNFSDNDGFSQAPAIAVSANNMYVVWEDATTGNFEILYRTSSNSGATFPPILTNLSANPAIS